LWVGNYSKGLAHYTAQGQWQVFDMEYNNSQIYVSDLLSDTQGGVWVGTWYGGLFHCTVQGKLQAFNSENSGLPKDRIDHLLSDGQGGVWIVSDWGERGLTHLTFGRKTELCTQTQIDATICQATLTVDNKMSATMMFTAGQTVTLQAKTTSMPSTVTRVWAVIRPPAIAQILDTNGTPILAFPRLELGHAKDNPELWQGAWNEAVYNGNYLITFYAQDNEKNIASSEQDTVLTVTGGIDPPAQAQVQIHLEKDRYQRGETFKVSLTEELGWGYDLYAAVLLPDKKTFMTLNGTNGLRPVNEAKPWYAPRKPHSPLTLFDLTVPATLPTGEYCLFGILSPEQGDVFETAKQNLWVMDTKCVEVVP
jgi:hypothetical protein